MQSAALFFLVKVHGNRITRVVAGPFVCEHDVAVARHMHDAHGSEYRAAKSYAHFELVPLDSEYTRR